MSHLQQSRSRWWPTFYAIGGTLVVLGGFVLCLPSEKRARGLGELASSKQAIDAPQRERALAPVEAPEAAAKPARGAAPADPISPAVAVPVPPSTPEPIRSVEELRRLTNEDDLPRVVYTADPRRLEEPEAPGQRDDDAAHVHDERDPRLENEVEPRVRQLSHDQQSRLNDTL